MIFRTRQRVETDNPANPGAEPTELQDIGLFKHPPYYDVRNGAGAYVSIAGVLAGFAFAAVVL